MINLKEGDLLEQTSTGLIWIVTGVDSVNQNWGLKTANGIRWAPPEDHLAANNHWIFTYEYMISHFILASETAPGYINDRRKI